MGFATPTRWHQDICLDGEACDAADVDGDGRADAIAYRPATKDVRVALTNATATGFGAAQVWAQDFDCGTWIATNCRAGDVNGDGKADLVLFAKTRHPWWVGAGFVNKYPIAPAHVPRRGRISAIVAGPDEPAWTGLTWDLDATEQPGWHPVPVLDTAPSSVGSDEPPMHTMAWVGSTPQPSSIINAMLGWAMLVTSYDVPVYVRLSTGAPTTTGPNELWSEVGCYPRERCELADMNGDGMADIVAFAGSTWGYANAWNKRVFVGTSDGDVFRSQYEWSSSFCAFNAASPHTCLVGDYNADGMSDAIDVQRATGEVVIARTRQP